MIRHIDNDGHCHDIKTPILWTVRARMVSDSGRVTQQKIIPDLTSDQSREAMRTMSALGWDCVRSYQ